MNSFRDSLLRQYDRLKTKVDSQLSQINVDAHKDDENDFKMFKIQYNY